MAKHIIVLTLSLFTVVVAAGNLDITHLMQNDAHLIGTSRSNYAITEQSLTRRNWSSVSFNGNQLIFYSTDCQVGIKTVDDLTNSERDFLENVKNKLIREAYSIEYQPQNNLISNGFRIIGKGHYGSTTNNNINGEQANISGFHTRSDVVNDEFASRVVSDSFDRNSNSITNNIFNIKPKIGYFYNYHGISLLEFDYENFSLAKDGLPNGLDRVFVNADLVTFVYRDDGQVQMKPSACLTSAEEQLLQELKMDIHRVKAVEW